MEIKLTSSVILPATEYLWKDVPDGVYEACCVGYGTSKVVIKSGKGQKFGVVIEAPGHNHMLLGVLLEPEYNTYKPIRGQWKIEVSSQVLWTKEF